MDYYVTPEPEPASESPGRRPMATVGLFALGFGLAFVMLGLGYWFGRWHANELLIDALAEQGWVTQPAVEDRPAVDRGGSPPTAVMVETELGPIWIDGSFAYADDCEARGITEQSATAALTKAGHPPTGGFVTWGLGCS